MTTFDTLLLMTIFWFSLGFLFSEFSVRRQREKAEKAKRKEMAHKINALWESLMSKPSAPMRLMRLASPIAAPKKSRKKRHGKPRGHGPKRKRGGG